MYAQTPHTHTIIKCMVYIRQKFIQSNKIHFKETINKDNNNFAG